MPVFAQPVHTSCDGWGRLDVEDWFGSLRHFDLAEWSDLHIHDHEAPRLLRQVMRVRVIDEGAEQPPRTRGIEEGMRLSRLFSNLYLHEALEAHAERFEQLDIVYARYVDDILLVRPTTTR